MSKTSEQKLIRAENGQAAGWIDPLHTLMRSFFRRVLHHLAEDMEDGIISPRDLVEISRELRKCLYQ